MGTEELAHKLNVLRQHCDDLGRDYGEIEKTALGQVNLGEGGMEPNDLIEFCRGLAASGIETFIFSITDEQELWQLEKISEEVIPVVQGF
jgi:hypothetical protein